MGLKIKTVHHRVGKLDHFYLNYLSIIYSLYLVYVCGEMTESFKSIALRNLSTFLITETFVLSIHGLQQRVVSCAVEIKSASDCKATQSCGIYRVILIKIFPSLKRGTIYILLLLFYFVQKIICTCLHETLLLRPDQRFCNIVCILAVIRCWS